MGEEGEAADRKSGDQNGEQGLPKGQASQIYDDSFYERELQGLINTMEQEYCLVMGMNGIVSKKEKYGVLMKKPCDEDLLKPQHYIGKFTGYLKNLGFSDFEEFSDQLRFEGALYRIFQNYFTSPRMRVRKPEDPYPWHLTFNTEGIHLIDSHKLGPTPLGLYLGCCHGFAEIFECSDEGVKRAEEGALNSYSNIILEENLPPVNLDEFWRAFYFGSVYGNLRVASGLVMRTIDEATDCQCGIQQIINTANFQLYRLAQLDENASIVGETLYNRGFFKERFSYDKPKSRIFIYLLGKPNLGIGPEILESKLISKIKVLHSCYKEIKSGSFIGKAFYLFHVELDKSQMIPFGNYYTERAAIGWDTEVELEYKKNILESQRVARRRFGTNVKIRVESSCFDKLDDLIKSGDITLIVEERNYKKSKVYISFSFLKKEEKEEFLKRAEFMGMKKPSDKDVLKNEDLRRAFPWLKKMKDKLLKRNKLET